MSVLTTALAKEYAQIDHTADDNVIALAIDTAEEYVCKVLGVRIYATSGDAAVEEYCDGGGNSLWPLYHPITAVNSVFDADPTPVELVDSDDYRFNAYRIFYKLTDRRWHVGDGRWLVNYDAGYLESDVPSAIKSAMLKLVARILNNRDDMKSEGVSGLSRAWSALWSDNDFRMLLEPYRFFLPSM